MPNKSPIIDPKTVLDWVKIRDFVLIDARASKSKYAANHLAGALHVDLNTDLADIKPDAADGGRHPLPSTQQFAKSLMQLGITPQSTVVIYDDKNGANAAARFWWMLTAIGHPSVFVIDGGFDAAIAAGYPLSNGIGKPLNVAPYPVGSWQLPLADIAEVDKATLSADFLIVDVREAGRYNGEFEPLDLIAGHIPNAVNLPYSDNLNTEGGFLSPAELHKKYEKAFDSRSTDQIIVHCGSGVTACHTLLSLAHAGMDIPKLYVGSWSEWSRNNRPMVLSGEIK